VVECLPTINEALGSILCTVGKKSKKKKKGREVKEKREKR
jgi:hypothetical protein